MWVSRALCLESDRAIASGSARASRSPTSHDDIHHSPPLVPRAGAEAQSQLTPSTPRGHTAMLPDHLAVGTVSHTDILNRRGKCFATNDERAVYWGAPPGRPAIETRLMQYLLPALSGRL